MFFDQAAKHWACGQLRHQAQRGVETLLFDSCGVRSSSNANALKIILPLFQSATVLIANDRIQSANNGCTYFAIDTARHLMTVDRYLGGMDMWQFAHHHAQSYVDSQLEQGGHQHVYTFPLPASLNRTMQSSKLLSINKHVAGPVNKRGEPGAYSSAKHFNADGQNRRLEAKFAKWQHYALKFLDQQTDLAIASKMCEHTLTGFKKRLGRQVHMRQHLLSAARSTLCPRHTGPITHTGAAESQPNTFRTAPGT